jgi:hypothetical protein
LRKLFRIVQQFAGIQQRITPGKLFQKKGGAASETGVIQNWTPLNASRFRLGQQTELENDFFCRVV